MSKIPYRSALVRLSALFCAAIIVAATVARAADTGWKKYTNNRFGFVLSYPASLSGGPEPTNGGGREFHRSNGEFSVAANAHFFQTDIGDTFEKRWEEEINSTDGSTINYKKKSENWYVVSGVTKKGYEFYHKLYRQGRNWAGFQITYPHAKAKEYDAWVTEIGKRFVPFLKGDYDRIEN